MLSKRRLKIAGGLICSFGFILFNIVAYQQVYAMLNFTTGGERTQPPESLATLQKVAVLFTGVKIPKPANESTPADQNLPFETHHLKLNETLSLEAWYIPREPASGVVLMFHGYAAAKSKLLPEARAFHDLGYSTFLVDFRGSGGSDGRQTSVGYYEAEDVAVAFAYARALAPEQPIILYGQSMGGAAVLRAIDIDGLEPDAVIIEAVFDKMLSTVQNRFSAMGLPAFPAAQALIFWGSVQSGYSGFQHNPLEYARDVNLPVLVLHGADDPRVTIDQAKDIFANLNGPKKFETFNGVGHASYVTAQPDKWKQVVEQFLTQYLTTP